MSIGFFLKKKLKSLLILAQPHLVASEFDSQSTWNDVYDQQLQFTMYYELYYIKIFSQTVKSIHD